MFSRHVSLATRFAPDEERQSAENHHDRRAPPHRYRKAGDDDAPPGEEPEQMNESDQSEHNHCGQSERLHGQPPGAVQPQLYRLKSWPQSDLIKPIRMGGYTRV